MTSLLFLAHDYNFTTDAETYGYSHSWFTAYNTDNVVFYVKACNDPHIALTDRMMRYGNMYEVALGIAGQ